MKYTLGTDPELFLSLGGKFVSAHGLFPGTKEKPFVVEKGAVQVDGLALEFNINPAKTAEEFNKNIETVLVQLKEMVHKVDKDFKLEFIPFAKFDQQYFKAIPDEAKILGCSPDYNAYGSVNPAPQIFAEPFRTAAGHMHIGWTKNQQTDNPNHFADCLYIAQHFATHSKGSFYEAREPLEKARIEYYGGDSAFRVKPYGVELRSPSNRWVENSKTREEMFNFTMKQMQSLTYT